LNLATVAVDAFVPLVGERFTLDAGEAGSLELELAEANPGLPGGPNQARDPFTLLFRGPAEPVLPQRIYRFEHSETGALEIFIVPVARDDSGTSYEAVFS
jgi:hypothetical protein